MERMSHLKMAGLVTLIAFVMNALLPFFAVYDIPKANAVEPSQQELSSVFGEKILLCTADGFKWVSWDELQEQPPAQEHAPKYECALCYVAAQGVALQTVTPSISAIRHPLVRHVPYHTADASARSLCLAQHLKSRAPPRRA